MKALYLAVLTISATACSSNPPAATSPAPAPATSMPPATASAPATATTTATAAARDVSGTWEYTVDAGGQIVPGELTLTRSGTNYTGTSTPQGMSTATVRSATITGDRVVILLDVPDGGDVSVDAVLSADGRSMSGIVNFQGQQLPFNARKR